MVHRPARAVPRSLRRALIRLNEAAFNATPVFRGLQELWWLGHARRVRRLEQDGKLRLHIGSGPQLLEGWVNIDIWCVPQILVMRMPEGLRRFRSESVRYIYSSHFFEHLRPTSEAPRFLAECHRVLAPGGVLRLAVPDIEPIARAYVAGDAEFFRVQAELNPTWCVTPMDHLSYALRQDDEHKHGYDFETLSRALRAAGFDEVERLELGESRHPALRVDYRHDVYPRTGKSLSVIVEATKGAARRERDEPRDEEHVSVG